MKLVNGLCCDENSLYFSFVSRRANKLIPRIEACQELDTSFSALSEFIKDHIEGISGEIARHEKKHNFQTSQIYFGVPSGYAKKMVVEDTVSLVSGKHPKKITLKDIIRAKRHIENVFVDFRDSVLHHVILAYDITGTYTTEPPLGLWAKRIKIKSMIIVLPGHVIKECVSFFKNFNLPFSGFIDQGLSDLSVLFSHPVTALVAVHCLANRTQVTMLIRPWTLIEKVFPFGYKTIVHAIADKFFLSPAVASQLLFCYSSFSAVSSAKEISLKDGDRYIHISSLSLNALIKDLVISDFNKILVSLNGDLGQSQRLIHFIGQLNYIDGFHRCIEDYVTKTVVHPQIKHASFPAYGVIDYACFRHLERFKPPDAFFDRIAALYREYF